MNNMKNFKINFALFSFVVVLITSCANDSTLENADNATNDSFVFQDGINNYEVNGKLEYDRKLIANSVQNAHVIHYDYPHNKVAIFTTQQVFEKYKNSDEVYKRAFEVPQEDEAISNTDLNEVAETYVDMPSTDENNQVAKAGGFDLNAFSLESDTNDLVLHQVYSLGIGGYWNTDLNSKGDAGASSARCRLTQRLENGTLKKSITDNDFQQVFSWNTSGYWKSRITNHSNKRKALYVYTEKNYGGNYGIFTFDKGKSYPFNFMVNFPVKSFKVLNL
jgi:hypothetical protein